MNVLVGHVVHVEYELAPLLEEKDPAGHGTGIVVPGLGQYEPAGHIKQPVPAVVSPVEL